MCQSPHNQDCQLPTKADKTNSPQYQNMERGIEATKQKVWWLLHTLWWITKVTEQAKLHLERLGMDWIGLWWYGTSLCTSCTHSRAQTSCWHHQSCRTVPSGSKLHPQKAELKITPNASSGCFPSQLAPLQSSGAHLSHLAFSDQPLMSWETKWAKSGRPENMERWNWARWERAPQKYLRCVLNTEELSNTARPGNARVQGKRTCNWHHPPGHKSEEIKITLWPPLVCS